MLDIAIKCFKERAIKLFCIHNAATARNLEATLYAFFAFQRQFQYFFIFIFNYEINSREMQKQKWLKKWKPKTQEWRDIRNFHLGPYNTPGINSFNFSDSR